jgi:hypothetical protein
MNNTMMSEIHGAKINPKSSLKKLGAENTRGRKLREQIQYLLIYFIYLTALSASRGPG